MVSRNDTIVAVATPVGVGSIGVIRLSGAGALKLSRKFWQPIQPIKTIKSHQMYLGWLLNGEQKLDQALLVYMRAPNSYTGEDVVEIQTHGSPVVLDQLLGLLVSVGARLAEPGEFTKRAYLNNKIDLIQAEAVAELIEAGSSKMAQLATDQLAGGVSTQLAGIAQELTKFVATESAQLDFSEEDLAPTDRSAQLQSIKKIITKIDLLLQGEDQLSVIRDGYKVALLGLPNAGKSSLLNHLLGHERSIVNAQAGTTRDTIAEPISINGLRVILVDTAGLRQSTGKIEQIGVARAIEQANLADLVLLLVEPNKQSATDQYWRSLARHGLNKKRITIQTKVDKIKNHKKTKTSDLYISTKTGQGITKLKQLIYQQAMNRRDEENLVLTTRRQFSLLHKVRAELVDAQSALNDDLPTDIVLVSVQSALNVVFELTGKVTNDEIIETIFANFCIGK